MNRVLLGVAIGAALMYFFDTERGEARRIRAAEWTRQYINADTITQARQATQQATQATVRQAKSLSGQVSDQVNQMRASRRSSVSTSAYDPTEETAVPQI